MTADLPFVPPREIRELRDYTRLRAELIEERSRHKQRLEKLLEDALIKLSTVATDLFGKSGRAMLEALIAGERDPEVRLRADFLYVSGRPPCLAREHVEFGQDEVPVGRATGAAGGKRLMRQRFEAQAGDVVRRLAAVF